MTNFIKKNINKIISIFLLLQPILDLLTGICLHTFNINVTIGIMIRILFLLLIIYVTTFVYKKKLPFFLSFMIFIYSIFYLLGIIIYKDGVLFKEIQPLVKVFYFPIILVSLYSIQDEIRISKMTLFITVVFYLISILIPSLLGIGFSSYEVAKIGTVGFFNAANEISGIISILTPIIFIYLKELKKPITKILFTLIYLFVILTIGTKTPLLTLLITIGVTVIYYMLNCIRNKTYKPMIYSIIVVIIGSLGFLLVIPKTNFYRNIETHLDFLKVDNILEVFTEKELIDHFIFSQRLTFLENKQNIYSNATTYEKLFGIGYINNNLVTKLIEIDYFDILYSHGLIGFIIFFSIYLYVFIMIIKNRNKDKTYDNFMIKISVLLILVLSFFTGHIITAPAVSIFAIILLLQLHKNKQNKIIIIANNKNTIKYNAEVEIINNSKTNLLRGLLLDYHNYDYAVYKTSNDMKLAKLYSKNVYKYSSRNKKINKLLSQ